jgi:hypothetical protein
MSRLRVGTAFVGTVFAGRGFTPSSICAQSECDCLAEPTEKQREEALGASLLAVYGKWQCEGEVRHLVAQQLVDSLIHWADCSLQAGTSAGKTNSMGAHSLPVLPEGQIVLN